MSDDFILSADTWEFVNPLTAEAKEKMYSAARKWDRLCSHAPEMLDLLKHCSHWFVGDIGGKDGRQVIEDLVKRIEGP